MTMLHLARLADGADNFAEVATIFVILHTSAWHSHNTLQSADIINDNKYRKPEVIHSIHSFAHSLTTGWPLSSHYQIP